MHRYPILRLLGLLSLVSTAAALHAQEVRPTPLAAGHPLAGAWRLDVPGTQCHEIYDIHADGTMDVTSGSQAASSVFEISAAPSPKGFYRWVDKIVKDNGKPDCTGSIMEVGHVATNYILLHPEKRQFVLCTQEDTSTCVGPFRKEGSDI